MRSILTPIDAVAALFFVAMITATVTETLPGGYDGSLLVLIAGLIYMAILILRALFTMHGPSKSDTGRSGTIEESEGRSNALGFGILVGIAGMFAVLGWVLDRIDARRESTEAD